MKVGYVTTYDARDIRNWSGTGYYIAHALQEAKIALDYIGPLQQRHTLALKGRQLAYKLVTHKRYLRERSPILLREYAAQISRHLRNNPADVVFSPGTLPLAYLDCEQPLVFWTDATFAGMIDFYESFCNLALETIREGNMAEQSALDRCRLAIYSSDWAAKSAIQFYNVDPAKVKVVSFGANLECHRTVEEITFFVRAKQNAPCRLLFVGVDWFRKGGPLALKVAECLNNMGLETELYVVGCNPPDEVPVSKFLKPIGFIPKTTEAGCQQLEALFSQSHFLILPSIAECTPIVFCEAASFGLPCLSTKIGGIPSVIHDNINGKLFAAEEPAQTYATYVQSMLSSYRDYTNLALSSFHEYQQRLNWKSAGKTIKTLLTNLL